MGTEYVIAAVGGIVGGIAVAALVVWRVNRELDRVAGEAS